MKRFDFTTDGTHYSVPVYAGEMPAWGVGYYARVASRRDQNQLRRVVAALRRVAVGRYPDGAAIRAMESVYDVTVTQDANGYSLWVREPDYSPGRAARMAGVAIGYLHAHPLSRRARRKARRRKAHGV